MRKSVLFALCIAAFQDRSFPASGLELTLSRPHADKAAAGRMIGTLSFFTTVGARWPGFSEWGIALMPSLSSAGEGVEGKVDGFAGAYAGHVFPLWNGLVRPGFQVGSIWEEVVPSEDGGTNQGGRLSLYGAVRIQVSCLSLLVSNRGQGIGFNFSF